MDSLATSMKTMGIKQMSIRYSGGGDSGGVDTITAFDKKGKKIPSDTEEISTLAETLLSTYVNQNISYWWDGDLSSEGELIVDLYRNSLRFMVNHHSFQTFSNDYEYFDAISR